MKYQRDHRQPTWLATESRAADDINQDDNADSASHFATRHSDIRKSSGCPPYQPNTQQNLVSRNTHVPTNPQQQSDPAHKHTRRRREHKHNRQDELYTAEHAQKTGAHRHTDVCTTDTLRHTEAHRCIFTVTGGHTHAHRLRHTNSRDMQTHSHTKIHSHKCTLRHKTPRQRNTCRHTEESKTHSTQC